MSLNKFANRINALMTEEKISKRALSLKTNVQRKSILNWISGKFYPRYDSMVKLADFFKVSIDYLLALEDDCFNEKYLTPQIEEIPKIFISNLNQLLSNKKISYYRLAKELDIGQSTVSKWIYYSSMPETAIIIKIAKLLNVSVDFLLGRID